MAATLTGQLWDSCQLLELCQSCFVCRILDRPCLSETSFRIYRICCIHQATTLLCQACQETMLALPMRLNQGDQGDPPPKVVLVFC